MSNEKSISHPHPDQATLSAYLESPQSDTFGDVRRHLIVCLECRQEVATLQRLVQDLRRYPLPEVNVIAGDHPNELLMADYVEKRLPPDRYEEVKRHIETCSFCTRAALHYAMESATTPELETMVQERKIQSAPKGAGFFDQVRRLFSRRVPLWAGLSLTAAAVLIVFAVIKSDHRVSPTTAPQQLAKREVLTILPYQDKPEVLFQFPGGEIPGIGFFDQAREKSEPFDSVTLDLKSPDQLRMTWPEIKSAKFYEVRIYSTDNGKRNLIGQAGTQGKTEVLLHVSGLETGKRYEWELSGTTDKGIRFRTDGGFVVGIEVRF